jgi:hypothetical protein
MSAVTLVLLGAILSVPFPRPKTSITRTNFDRIHEGMTLGEVEEILGCKPGNYAYARRKVMLPEEMGFDLGLSKVWFGDDAVICVQLDFDLRLRDKSFEPLAPVTLAERWYWLVDQVWPIR